MEREEFLKNHEESHRRGKIFGGILVVVIGLVYLAKESGLNIPEWLFNWKTLLIAIGIVIAIKHKFRKLSWLIIVSIGTIYLIKDYYPECKLAPFIWPIIIILFGLKMIFKPRNKFWCRGSHRYYRGYQFDQKNYSNQFNNDDANENNDSYSNSTAIMGAVKKTIISKNYKGGSIEAILGGAEINLLQADMSSVATLEISVIMGGVKLYIPSNWEVKSELTSIMAGIEDLRSSNRSSNTENTEKILILKGSVIMGSIEVKSI
ncbi:MAG: hypothetical protein JSU07_06110 [Bacteroidetes bacterium]|nr:hypothetical protein [Bacteroidota bacterium]